MLTTAPAPRWSAFSTAEKLPPLGLGFLASCLREKGHRVFFIDNYLERKAFVRDGYLQDNQIDLVGMYVNSVCFQEALKVLRRIQRERRTGGWRGLVAVGGPHVSVASRSIPEWVDYVVIGEGERAIVDIADGNCRGRIVRYPVEDELDRLPPPAWDLFAELPYHQTTTWTHTAHTFSMNTSRGCPFSCTFCSVQGVWGRTYRTFSARRVVDDIAYLVRTYGANGICFREDHFTLDRKRTVDICERLLGQGIKIDWSCETRADCLDRDLLALMKRAGCGTIYVGVESGSPRMLERLRKRETVEDFRQLFRWTRELGVKTYASLIAGIPGETADDRRLTKRFISEIRPDIAAYNVFVALPGSPLYAELRASGRYSYVDKNGLLYLPSHNARVDRHYGYRPRAKIPRPVWMIIAEVFDFARTFLAKVDGKLRRIFRDPGHLFRKGAS